MKDFVLKLIQNGVVAVCEDLDEALEAQEYWASAVLLVAERGGDLDSSSLMPSEEFLASAVSELKIPVFVRVRYWHFWEAEIVQSYWAAAILESIKTDNSLEKVLNHWDFSIPIISEINSVEDFQKDQNNYLLLWEYATWNVIPLLEKLKEWKNKTNLNIFVGGGISNPADIKLIKELWAVSGYFIWTALFDVYESRDYLKDVISYIK